MSTTTRSVLNLFASTMEHKFQRLTSYQECEVTPGFFKLPWLNDAQLLKGTELTDMIEEMLAKLLLRVVLKERTFPLLLPLLLPLPQPPPIHMHIQIRILYSQIVQQSVN